MKTVFQSIATLLLGAISIMPLGAQLDLRVEDVDDPSSLEEMLILDSEGVGQRVTKRLSLTFDPGDDRTISLRSVRISGSSDFSYDLETSRLPILIRNTITYEMLVLFLPTGPGPTRATLELTVRQSDVEEEPEDLVYTIQLLGRVPAYSLSYVLPGASRSEVAPGGVLDFGHRAVERVTTATLVLSNTGSGPGTVRSIRIEGSPPFAIASPPTLPVTLQPGQDLNFELAFEPTRTTVYQGQLSLEFGVGLQQFVLTGVGGDLLLYRLVRYRDSSTAGPARDVQSGDTIVFGAKDASVAIVATNIRQSVQRIDGIRLTGDFRLVESPSFPHNVGPGESFSVRIAPIVEAPGELSGELLIGDAYFPVRADVPTLPGVRFSEAGGVVDSAAQIPLEVSLEGPYPTDIVGVLLLGFETRAFTNDPAIQWATGGRQAVFEIPAGETQPIFAGNVSTNTFQTGTVAGAITVTAQFFVDTRSGSSGATGGQGDASGQSGGVEITPDTAPELRFEVMEAAPVLQRVALGTTAQGRFSVQITGYATSRTVDSLSFSFSGVSGSNLTTPNLEADVGTSFSTYYGGSQSAAFGSQFTATVEFTLDEGVFEDLSSLSVGAANGLGASNSVSLQLN